MIIANVETFIQDEHLESIVDVLQEVQRIDGDYPPRQDAVDSRELLRDWLLKGGEHGRWVAIVGPKIVGHIALSHPGAYLTDNLSRLVQKKSDHRGYSEIAKLFVHPDYRGAGIASQLLTTARIASWDQQLQPALAVVQNSRAAIRLYLRGGLVQVGEFEGIHGHNFVFMDEDSD